MSDVQKWSLFVCSVRSLSLSLSPRAIELSRALLRHRAGLRQVIPMTLAQNSGADGTKVLNQLRQKHAAAGVPTARQRRFTHTQKGEVFGSRRTRRVYFRRSLSNGPCPIALSHPLFCWNRWEIQSDALNKGPSNNYGSGPSSHLGTNLGAPNLATPPGTREQVKHFVHPTLVSGFPGRLGPVGSLMEGPEQDLRVAGLAWTA